MPYALIQQPAQYAAMRLANNSIQTIITSPPYHGHRDYDNEPSVFGGIPSCNHDWLPPIRSRGQSGALGGSTLQGAHPGAERRPRWTSTFCRHCGAWLGNLGLEPSHSMYVRHVADILNSLHRPLRADGTLWLNVADSYAATVRSTIPREYPPEIRRSIVGPTQANGKNLLGIPWRIAQELREFGWILRTDVIWYRRNAPPQSAHDRPHRDHEYIFLFSKEPRYVYRQPPDARIRRTVWDIPLNPFPGSHIAPFPESLPELPLLASTQPGDVVLDPFSGSGTTGVVALDHNRSYIGFEPHPHYYRESLQRLTDAYINHRGATT